MTLPPEAAGGAAAVPTASATALVLPPARSGSHLLGRQGAGFTRGPRWCRAGGDDRTGRRMRRSSPPRRRSGDSCCTTWVSSMSTTHGHRVRRAQIEATPQVWCATSYSTRCPAPHNVLGSSRPLAKAEFVEIGKRDIYGDLGSKVVPFAATCRCMPSTWRYDFLHRTVTARKPDATHGRGHAAGAAGHYRGAPLPFVWWAKHTEEVVLDVPRTSEESVA